MTFELVRMGWPNTAAILVLAVAPVLALAAPADRRPETTQAQQIAHVTTCEMPSACALIAAASVDTVLE